MDGEIVRLEATERDGRIEVVDELIGGWLAEVALADPSELLTGSPSPSAAVVAGTLAQQLPEVARLVKESSAIKVVFSPEIRKALATGQYRLMQSGKDAIPVAVDATGRIVGHAGVAPESAAALGGGVALGAAATVAWPVVLAGAVASAAAYSQQRWLERTFADLQDAVGRIERRLRDDDAGTLEAANALADLVSPSVTSGYVTPYLRLELAAARQDVERIYRSRRRFVVRFIRALEEEQNEKEKRTGKSVAWVDVADELRDRDTGVFDELVLFLQAMIVRGRVTACAAAVVAADGDGQSALRMLDGLEPEVRADYYELYRRVRALAQHGPQDSLFERIGKRIPLYRGDDQAGAAEMAWLERAMENSLGRHLESVDDELSVVIPSSLVLAGRAR